MPFDPVILFGTLGAHARREFSEPGLLVETVDFTPEQEVKAIKGHSPGALGQTQQVQIWQGDLKIEIKGGIIPNAQGLVHGLPAGYVGMAVTNCAHFAAATNDIPALERHGYTRNPDKLLAITDAKTSLGEEAPNCSLTMTYYPQVGKDQIALPA